MGQQERGEFQGLRSRATFISMIECAERMWCLPDRTVICPVVCFASLAIPFINQRKSIVTVDDFDEPKLRFDTVSRIQL